MPSDPRNGSGRGTPVPGGQSQAEMTKAQMFEDEKRRIVESCFAKKDPDGSRRCTPVSLRPNESEACLAV